MYQFYYLAQKLCFWTGIIFIRVDVSVCVCVSVCLSVCLSVSLSLSLPFSDCGPPKVFWRSRPRCPLAREGGRGLGRSVLSFFLFVSASDELSPTSSLSTHSPHQCWPRREQKRAALRCSGMYVKVALAMSALSIQSIAINSPLSNVLLSLSLSGSRR